MPKMEQAPMLLAKGEKQRSSNYWSYDPDLLSWVAIELGKSASQLRLMLYLMGNAPGKWRCSTADVLNRTGICDKGSLSKIKKALKERGWIDYAEGDHITVLYDNMYAQMNAAKSQGCSQN